MIKVFADCADWREINTLARDDRVEGFTTNPSLARAAGVTNYREFIADALRMAQGKPISIEVLSDDFTEMHEQAVAIARMSPAAVVKIPVINSEGKSSTGLIEYLAAEGVRLNVTAVFTEEQVVRVGNALAHGRAVSPIVSVFAGRIADAGVDPLVHVSDCRHILARVYPEASMLWASARQVYDVELAECAGCEIITLTPPLIAKLSLRGRDLTEYSRETVAAFARDARLAGLVL